MGGGKTVKAGDQQAIQKMARRKRNQQQAQDSARGDNADWVKSGQSGDRTPDPQKCGKKGGRCERLQNKEGTKAGSKKTKW